MAQAEDQMRKALRTAAFNNGATAEFLRGLARLTDDDRLVEKIEAAARQLEVDADTFDVFVAEICEGRIKRFL